MRKILLLLLITSYVHAQCQEHTSNKDLKTQIVLPSVSTQYYEKHFKTSELNASGNTTISIPLYEIKLKGGLTIPIELTYDNSGIKYAQYDGAVGAGWAIDAMGYRVSRNVYGKPDEKYPRYSYRNEYQKYFDPSSRDIKAEHENYLLSIATLDQPLYYYGYQGKKFPFKDSQYDMFTYMLPTSLGRFIIKDINTFNTHILGDKKDIVKLNHS